MSDCLLKAWQVADWLGYAAGTVVDWAEAGEIPAYKVGGRWRFRQSEIEAWLGERRSGPEPGRLGAVT